MDCRSWDSKGNALINSLTREGMNENVYLPNTSDVYITFFECIFVKKYTNITHIPSWTLCKSTQGVVNYEKKLILS